MSVGTHGDVGRQVLRELVHALGEGDAVQALGKLPLALETLPVAYASFSAHKLGGPKGIGALYVRPGVELTPLLRGGSQERGRRPGTENVPGIVGFGAACAAAQGELEVAHVRHELAVLWGLSTAFFVLAVLAQARRARRSA